MAVTRPDGIQQLSWFIAGVAWIAAALALVTGLAVLAWWVLTWVVMSLGLASS